MPINSRGVVLILAGERNVFAVVFAVLPMAERKVMFVRLICWLIEPENIAIRKPGYPTKP